VFAPRSIALREAGLGDPYGWLVTEKLTWSGTFRGVARQLEVTASPELPFSTDLASVPRSLTWLFPRYGKYTKAAVLHDFLCQNFRNAPSTASAAPSCALSANATAECWGLNSNGQLGNGTTTGSSTPSVVSGL